MCVDHEQKDVENVAIHWLRRRLAARLLHANHP